MSQAGLTPILVLDDGKPSFEGAPSEGEHARATSIMRGVPADAIIAGPGVHHVASSIPHYRAAVFAVTPLPCHFPTRGEAERFRWMRFVPTAAALDTMDLCGKNWLGRLVGLRVEQDPKD